ncbi:MAG: hypothetical protein HYY32_03600 [Chloroflexi bacterium]|nr:hypothetical protein [Chloroflexota bacterium]
MKRLAVKSLPLLLILVMAALLTVGCGSPQPSTTQPPQTITQSPTSSVATTQTATQSTAPKPVQTTTQPRTSSTTATQTTTGTTAPSTTSQTLTAASRPVVAVVKVKAGTAEYRSATSAAFVAAPNGTGISVGDRVRSGAGAEVAVEFQDGSSLVLLQNTEIEIQNYSDTREGGKVVTRVARVATITGGISGDVRDDLIYPPSVFEIVSAGEVYTIKGTLSK